MKKTVSFITAILGFSIISFGQVNATATATATIITPISISNNIDLNFGNISVNATGGTVIITPASNRSITGGVTLPNFNVGTVTAATFKVTGTPDYTYYITLPSTPTIVKSSTNQMTVDTFTSNPDLTGKILSNGEQLINVGATLTVLANQPAGIYVSEAPFTITVNYN